MTIDWNAVRLDLLAVDEPMRASLREMRPLFAKVLPGILSHYYDKVRHYDAASPLFRDGVVHSLTETVPLSKTMKEKIAALRTWCKTRARPASSAYETETKDATRKLETA